MSTQTRGSAAERRGKAGQRKARTTPALFFRQIVAELRRVIWPTRREMLTYTAVVLVFVLIMVAIVTGLDYVLTKAVLAVFG